MLIYKRVIILLYIVLPFHVAAQTHSGNSLRGTIVDSHNNPMYGAVITIPDLHTGGAADSLGRYKIPHLPKGRLLVQVHMIGYNTITEHILISGETVRDFTLSESVLERSEVVVTGTSLATEQRKSATPIQSITLQELQENAASNVIDALTRLPGVSQVSTGPAISKPLIRGLGANRIVVISDGLRQEGQQWGDEHSIEVDDYNISKIEVLKGPASLAYGSDALAGVINIISYPGSLRGADKAFPNRKLGGNVTLNYQTNNGLSAAHVALGGGADGFAWDVFGTGKAAHDYRNEYDGYVHNSRFQNLNYGASLAVNKRWGHSRLAFSSFNQKVGIAEGDRDSATGRFTRLINNNGSEEEVLATDESGKSYDMETPYQSISHQKLSWNSHFFLGNGSRLGLTLGYQQNTRKEFEDVLSPDEAGLQLSLNTYNYDVRYYFPVVREWQVTAGVNGMYQRNQNKGAEFLIPDHNLFDVGVYTIARRDIGKWSLSGGLRYDHRSLSSGQLLLDSLGERSIAMQEGGTVKFSPFDRTFSAFTGSLGASYALSQSTTLKMNIARGYRAPNIAELSANGVHEGTIRYEYGNTSLVPEQSLQADLGMEYNAAHVHFSAAAFYNHVGNFIYVAKLAGQNGTDSIPSAGNEEGYPAFGFRQSTARLYGGEAYIDIHPHPLDWLHLENTFSFVRGQIISGSDSTGDLPFMPPPRWLIGLRVQKRSFNSWLSNGYVRLGADINFRQSHIFSAYDTESATPGYTLFSASFGADITSGSGRTFCSITVAGQNLLNSGYQSHLSRLKYASENYLTGRTGIYNQGRNVSLILRFPF